MQHVCEACYGTGILLGNGMIQRDCHHCHGVGKIEEPDSDELDYLEVKQTERFEEAKQELQKEFPKMSDKDADKLMRDALKKNKHKKS